MSDFSIRFTFYLKIDSSSDVFQRFSQKFKKSDLVEQVRRNLDILTSARSFTKKDLFYFGYFN